MKRLFNFLLPVSIMALFIIGCDDGAEDVGPAVPTMSLQVADTSIESFTGFVGDSLEIEVDLNVPGVFDNLEVLENGVRDTLVTSTDVTDMQDPTIFYNYYLDEEGTFTLNFEVTDSIGQSTAELVTITANERPTRTYTAVLLYAPTGNLQSETFFSTNDGSVYSREDVESTQQNISSTIDFGYYYGETDEASLTSPNSYPSNIYDLEGIWEALNATKIRETNLSVSEYLENETDPEFISNAFDEATPEGDGETVTDLQIGQVLAFELDPIKGRNNGLIRILDVEPGLQSNDFIEIEVVVVK